MSVLAIHDLMPLSLSDVSDPPVVDVNMFAGGRDWIPLPVVNLAKKEGCVALKESQKEPGNAPPSADSGHSLRAGTIALHPQSSNNRSDD